MRPPHCLRMCCSDALGQREACLYVDIEQLIQLFVVHLVDGAAAERGGVVQHDVEPAEQLAAAHNSYSRS